jgi:hypothetical protein
VLRYSARGFAGLPRAAFVAALESEGVPCDAHFYDSLTRSQLLQPDARRFPAWSRRAQAACPVAERAAYEEAVWLPHFLFLGAERDVDQIVEAIRKIEERGADLIGFEHPAIERQRQVRTRRK